MEQEVFKQYLGQMQALCSRSEKCRTDIQKKLQQKEISSEDVNNILQALENDGFIDEVRYTKAYVHDKSRLQGWGPRKISGMLKMKGIPQEIIESALSQLDEESLVTRLKEALNKKDKTIKDTDPVKRHARLVRLGISKGYNYWQVLKVLEILKNEN
ncbi:MAG: regulatory protein RecX [Bacteroidales bacterium]|jgi:regulatory protein